MKTSFQGKGRIKGKKVKGKTKQRFTIGSIGKLFLVVLPLFIIATSSLPATQAQNANTALTIRADVQEANANTGVVTATGNVKMSYPARQIDAIAEQAQYFSKEQRVVLTGNVVVTQEGVNSIKAQTITYLVSEGKFVASPPDNQQVETIYVVPDREAINTPVTSASPVNQIKPAFKKQQVSSPSLENNSGQSKP
ncbi:MAG: LptA/OstA family protein [Pseudanabaena sp.]|jgi:lipopolysaccharide export system protein LptA|nr:OstA family protein [Pseudanabaena sp. M109S1SP2A07QC]MCA6574076.1 OstA family protein [Pseudanabaena sp. M53BS1SP1A06MG]MCA6583806.1 OstA family protein [Pseudanabaena sp. M34BS1SP1A06MG]MCA6587070.1 OstA family protein [Pseudanabaena sp. M051S1SP1A06QC]MCA6591876.1 OstA family protein [Pseudanabaena sp. M38BS1SP1A06MG]MCA6595052.1 OstA family protein [Pseudanabaena sp. M046S1SP1A06QC]MCA6599299.1 OstA family protein [Pseudanabaena sp. M57BS1SP1A06MG]MCA6613969.1 OstA family protein [Pse